LTREEERPNIILISIDALRADHLSLYGYPYQTSPQIDEFAKRSTVFEYAYSLIPKTSASFASLMTGLHPFILRTQPNQDSLNEKFITLAEALKLRNYSTEAIVDNSNLSPKFKFNQGFDRYITVWEDREKREESTPYITQKVLEFLAHPPGKPFFLWAHYIEPHFPYVPPSRFIEDRPEGRVLGEIPRAILVGNLSTAVDRQSKKGHYLALYDAAIKYVDSEFGKIMSLITEKGRGRGRSFPVLIIWSMSCLPLSMSWAWKASISLIFIKIPKRKKTSLRKKSETLRLLQQRLTEFFANPTYSKRAAETNSEVPLSKRELERLRVLGYIR